MLSKNQRAYDPAQLRPGGQRLGANLADLVNTNVLPAKRVQEVINDIADAGVRGFKKRKISTNTARALRRSLLTRTQWPPVYLAQVRVMSKKTRRENAEWMAFLLPHELLEVLHRVGKTEMVMDTSGCDPKTLRHLRHCEAEAGCRLVPLGLWGDGVPCNWDRTESVMAFSLNFPGQAGQYKPLRVPITGFSHKQLSRHTYDDVLAVVAWSFQYLAAGVRPGERHDGRP